MNHDKPLNKRLIAFVCLIALSGIVSAGVYVNSHPELLTGLTQQKTTNEERLQTSSTSIRSVIPGSMCTNISGSTAGGILGDIQSGFSELFCPAPDDIVAINENSTGKVKDTDEAVATDEANRANKHDETEDANVVAKITDAPRLVPMLDNNPSTKSLRQGKANANNNALKRSTAGNSGGNLVGAIPMSIAGVSSNSDASGFVQVNSENQTESGALSPAESTSQSGETLIETAIPSTNETSTNDSSDLAQVDSENQTESGALSPVESRPESAETLIEPAISSTNETSPIDSSDLGQVSSENQTESGTLLSVESTPESGALSPVKSTSQSGETGIVPANSNTGESIKMASGELVLINGENQTENSTLPPVEPVPQNGEIVIDSSNPSSGETNNGTSSDLVQTNSENQTESSALLPVELQPQSGETIVDSSNPADGQMVFENDTTINGLIRNDGIIYIDSDALLTLSGAVTGNGSFVGDVLVDGSILAGNSPGLMTFDNVILDNSNLLFEVESPINRGTTFDGIDINGDLQLIGDLMVDVQYWNNPILSEIIDYSFEFVNVVGNLLDAEGNVIQTNPAQSIYISDGWVANWVNTFNGWSLELSTLQKSESVDAPGSISLLLLGLGSILMMRRKNANSKLD